MPRYQLPPHPRTKRPHANALPRRAAALLRDLVRESGLQWWRLTARGAGNGTLARAMAGQNISLASLDQLTRAAGYEITGFRVRLLDVNAKSDL